MATCGVSAGADAVYDRLKELIEKEDLPFELQETGCIGLCAREPIIEVRDENGESTFYVEVDPKKAEKIARSHLEGKRVDEYMMDQAEYEQYYGKQKKIVLRNSGLINPHSIDDYIERDGYKAIEKVLNEMTPEQVIQEILDSGLRGRGGAGFPTGLKWKFARAAKGEPKYLVVNGDEGDPGAFMDRTVLESDPHNVIEGMLIAAYAIGATKGYAYIRAEYPRAVRHFNEAIEQARERGLLGERIMGKDFTFDLRVKEGAGAFVCGEETALIASIEGYRGVPRTRPPYPANHGLWGKPTNINNVETFANIAWIIRNGWQRGWNLSIQHALGHL
jgi:NADH-quinone oxidoreductase subunit F